MMLKRKKFVIQWRKFGLKRSCIFKVMNFQSLCPFWDFNLNFNEFLISISYLKSQKGVFYLFHRPWCWRGTRSWYGAELTWRAGPPRGCDAALRRRDRAAGGPRKAQVAHKVRTRGRRPRVSTRTPVWGTTWRGGGGSAFGRPTG